MKGRAEQEALAHRLALQFGIRDSETFEQILTTLLSTQEIELALLLPSSSEEIATALDIPREEAASILRNLYMRGVVVPREQAADQLEWDILSVRGFMDAILMDPRYDVLGESFRKAWRRFYNHDLVRKAPSAGALRVIPIEKAIDEISSRILPFESAEGIIQEANRVAVQRCPCRVREARCDAPLEVCLSLDEVADYVMERGVGREISKREARAILTQAEQLGLVHQTWNHTRPTVICNCCTCCCVALRAMTVYGQRAASAPSRYRPSVEEDSCTACLSCVEACHFSAMFESDGQRSLNSELCVGCGLCVAACPESAIALIETLPAKHIPPHDRSSWTDATI